MKLKKERMEVFVFDRRDFRPLSLSYPSSFQSHSPALNTAVETNSKPVGRAALAVLRCLLSVTVERLGELEGSE